MPRPSRRQATWPSEEASQGVRGSVYRETETHGQALAPLQSDVEVEVAIVGGGFTGLSAALHLHEKQVSVALLEAHDPGWGASGRNGGQVNPGLKHEPSAVVATFGRERGEALIRTAGEAPGYLFSLVEKHAIACCATRNGTIRVVRTAREDALIRASIEDWARYGATLTHCDRLALAALIGTDTYPVGLLDPRGGHLDPLAYAQGLARAVVKTGGTIFARSPASGLSREGNSWRVRAQGGSVKAHRVLLATNGYTGPLWPGLKRSIVPLHSAIVASEPLPEEIAASILPGRHAVYESSWRVLYFRVDAAGRFLIGGPSALRDVTSPSDYRHLIVHAEQLFPALRGRRWTHFWNGRVAVTQDHYPHLNELAPGLYAALGYNGRGVAMATAMGRIVADLFCGAPQERLALPVTRLRPIRFHALWKPVVALRRARGSTLDRIFNR